VDDEALTVGSTRIPRSAVGRIGGWAVHLRAASARADEAAGTAPAGARLTVPLAEERLAVGTREVDLGEIEIRKRVVEETVMQPVTLRREIVEVVQRDADGNEIGAREISPPGTAQRP
jgi:stress response protein YsnF